MVRKRSPDRAAESPGIDDLKLINGIGLAVEKWLNGVGIFTFAQLVALSPADISAALADLTGLSAERIIKQDWIGQARKLGSEAVAKEAQRDVEAPVEPSASIEHVLAATRAVESEKDAVPSIERYHPATFTVEFLLNEHNDVHSTRILHVQSEQEDTWTGWQKTLLVDFLCRSAGLNIPLDEPALLNTEEHVNAGESGHMPEVVTKSELLTPLATKPRLTGMLRVREMAIVGVESSGPRRTLTHDAPFDVQLILDLTGLQVPGNTPLNYKASLYGKHLSSRPGPVLEENRNSRSGLALGKAIGTIIPADIVTIKVEKNTLPEGIYHLAGIVIIGLPSMKLAVRPGTTAVIDGGQVQVGV